MCVYEALLPTPHHSVRWTQPQRIESGADRAGLAARTDGSTHRSHLGHEPASSALTSADASLPSLSSSNTSSVCSERSGRGLRGCSHSAAGRPTSAQPCGLAALRPCSYVTRRIAPNWSAVHVGTVVAHGGAEPHNISSTTPTAQMSPFVLSQTGPRRSTKSSCERCGRGDPNAYRRVTLQCH